MIVKLHKPIFLFLICAVLTLTKTAPASDCSPNSAWLTYAADDYLTFYVNGNPVINSARDPGAVNTTIGIPIVYFNAAGVANYFAAKVTNDQANIVGGLWLITIKCADGSYSYISNEDATYQMYDDLSGGSPPPGPGNWYDPGYTDPANKFTGAPVLATPAFWFAPVTNPITGNPLMMLSHNAGGTQSSVSEVLYFREQVIIPTPMPTLTPTIPQHPIPLDAEPRSCKECLRRFGRDARVPSPVSPLTLPFPRSIILC